ncbi:carboxymuconolactone decarboxylase family protein [uncultured Sulfitobacter sp.]|uniref:carboxymuconolactone decarboxylase family protein n=1 Tax=uncultured Sulfitobacter sp. TaxID=191468 RepID=UPI002628E374|nr:carboxymuconolactone decarboxylase family protein [uncultured Sulfitobacter sp.]
MSDKNPFEALFKQAQELTKAVPMADAFSPKVFEAMMGTMPKDMMEMMFGNTVNKDGLDARTRLLLTIAGMTTQGAQVDTVFRQTVRHALEAGATEQHIKETIAQTSVFAGLPSMTRALELASQVFDEKEGKA